MTTYDCGDAYCRDGVTPSGCKGHRLTHDVRLAADVIAWCEGYDNALASDQAEEYYRSAAKALLAIEAAS
jgi:hypothetical protein